MKSRLGIDIDFKFIVHSIFQSNGVVAETGSLTSKQINFCRSCPEIEKDNMERIASFQTSSVFCLKAEISTR